MEHNEPSFLRFSIQTKSVGLVLFFQCILTTSFDELSNHWLFGRCGFQSVSKWINKDCVSHFHIDSENISKQKQNAATIFKASVILSIPNFAIMPTLEEIQQTLNKAADCIVSTMKGVGQWSKERLSKVWVYVLQGGLLINSMQFQLLKSKVFFFPFCPEKVVRTQNACFTK